jgi:hypothetical protein
MRGKAASPGDTNVSQNGYHYTRTETRWRLTHHLLAEEMLRRPIKDDEQVYFLDGDRTHLVMDNIGVRPKLLNGSKRKGQLYARIEQLIAEYVDGGHDIADIHDLVEQFETDE